MLSAAAVLQINTIAVVCRSRLRSKVSQCVAHAIADAYETVYAAIAEPHNGYLSEPLATEALQHTPAHVRTILGIASTQMSESS